ncbi:hypothetical protein PAXRUDRAFT_823058 [Paxillus rubicundulus Ve08.2h10]|uniref:Uncharacterized protein n=1 Tax=Paxillus rubicundulus Ve08.2h10 TaxID=930991 RepID=A0A0D0E953_9AGAM|nr:hypothetical protein PAXRUDRAFT_823058 [Paxillus rubicundulus Ve08.2h10]
MSEFDGTSLGAVFVNIDTPAPDDSPLRLLAGLADRAFELADQNAGYDPSAISSDIKARFARILYPIDNPEMKPRPIKVVLHLQQNCTALHVSQVTVDFQTRTAECDGRPNLAIEPEQFDHVLGEIESYLEAAWKRKNGLQRTCLTHENITWRGFIERLQARGLIPVDSLTVIEIAPTGKRCPLCNLRSTTCTHCNGVLCQNEACAASPLTPYKACSQHALVLACYACLEVAEALPPLGECPSCNLWFCSYELIWCLGRPKANSDRQPNAREHPVKAIGCSSCTVGDDLPRCSNDRCWSREGGYINFCKSCSPDGGLQCMCEQCWFCDDCKAATAPSCFMECPRCRKVYCLYACDYIQFCAECKRPTLCDDCIEEEEDSGAGTDAREGVSLEAECSAHYCLKKICGTCLETTRCSGCQNAFCSGCTVSQNCETCNVHFCVPCYGMHRGRCNKCGCEFRDVAENTF